MLLRVRSGDASDATEDGAIFLGDPVLGPELWLFAGDPLYEPCYPGEVLLS